MTAVTMRTRSLLSQVLAVNTVLVTVTAFVAAMLAPDDAAGLASLQRDLLIGVAVVTAVLVNTLLLRHRLKPLEHLVETMERVDLASPGQRAVINPNATRDIQRLTAAFNRMLARVEEERLEGGRAVIRAQEEERARIAQDLHDEVNQALTAILLRLQAAALDVPPGLRMELKEIQTLATQAMEELLTLARTLRPTALDDHGLVPALASQVANFGERTGIKTTFHRHGDTPELSDEEQLVLYRVAQESLSNVVQHSGASAVRVELSSVGRTVLRVRDDGCGFKPSGRNGRLGVSGMRERALLVGGRLNVFSAPGEGTTIELTMGAS
jgi:two-component system, NarL family, sensor histidine kinase UhpB